MSDQIYSIEFQEYHEIRRHAAKRGVITKKISALLMSGISIDSPEVSKLIKADSDLIEYIKHVKERNRR